MYMFMWFSIIRYPLSKSTFICLYNFSTLPDDTQLQPCKSEDFTADEMCNYLRLGQSNGAYQETVEKRVDMRTLAMWKKLYL